MAIVSVSIPGGGTGKKLNDTITLPVVAGPNQAVVVNTCKTCSNWQPANSAATTGKCRRHSPKPEVGGSNVVVEWPITDDTDSCGEHASNNAIGMNHARSTASGVIFTKAGAAQIPQEVQAAGYEVYEARALIAKGLATSFNIRPNAFCRVCTFHDGTVCRKKAPEPVWAAGAGDKDAVFPPTNKNADWCAELTLHPVSAQAESFA